MAVREQTVILNVSYEDEENDAPATWDWATLLDLDPDRVQVVMAGEVVASSDPTIDPTHHRKDPT